MNINLDELAKQEVERLVKEKINGKLHNQIQKELKNHNYTRMISEYVHFEMKKMLDNINLLDYIDKDKLQNDITANISNVLIERLSTSLSYEEY